MQNLGNWGVQIWCTRQSLKVIPCCTAHPAWEARTDRVTRLARKADSEATEEVVTAPSKVMRMRTGLFNSSLCIEWGHQGQNLSTW